MFLISYSNKTKFKYALINICNNFLIQINNDLNLYEPGIRFLCEGLLGLLYSPLLCCIEVPLQRCTNI